MSRTSARTFGSSQLRSGCCGREEVQVVLAGRVVPRPGRAAEQRRVVVGRPTVPAVPPEVEVPAGGVACAPAPLEPGMPVRGVVDHEVDDEADATRLQPRHQRVEVRHRAEQRRDRAVVADVVAVVDVRAGVVRAQPHHVDAERRDVVELGQDARQVADAVPVRVHEGTRVDLVDHRLLPPAPARTGLLARQQEARDGPRGREPANGTAMRRRASRRVGIAMSRTSDRRIKGDRRTRTVARIHSAPFLSPSSPDLEVTGTSSGTIRQTRRSCTADKRGERG